MQLNKITGISPDNRTFLPHSCFVLPYTLIGVEVETEGVYYDRLSNPTYWDVKEDGSLRSGAEFVLANPLVGKDLHDSLEILDAFCSNNPEIHYTVRTSVHVHLDVRDLEAEQLMNLLGLYLLFEKAIYRYHNHKYNRENNIYCLPFFNTSRHINDLSVLSYLGDPSISQRDLSTTLRHSLSRLNKYYGLNVASLFRFGSLEFRHMEGTHNKNEIIEWVNIIMSLKKYACSLQGNPYEMLLGVSNSGYTTLLSKVFSADLISKLFDYGDAEEDIYAGMQLFQDIIHGNKLTTSASVWRGRVDQKNPEYKESSLFKKSAKGNKKTVGKSRVKKAIRRRRRLDTLNPPEDTAVPSPTAVAWEGTAVGTDSAYTDLQRVLNNITGED